MNFLQVVLLVILFVSNGLAYKKLNIQDEVEDIDLLKIRNDATSDDYDSFNVKPLENRQISSLNNVKFTTVRSTIAMRPTLKPTTPIPKTVKAQVVGEGQIPIGGSIPSAYLMPDIRSLPRAGKVYEHYPYNKLSRAYRLRPDLYYVYPREFQNVVYKYPYEKLPYSLLTWYQQQQVANNAYNQYYNQYYGAYNNQQYQGQPSRDYDQHETSVTEKTEEPKFNDNFENEDFEKLAAEAAEEKNMEKTSSTTKTTTPSIDEDFGRKKKKN
uniref:Uncharacterized protein n=1 Tax=Strongyloides stercoralis TaxID=6248 RepID=A0A0K0EHI5_STRER